LKGSDKKKKYKQKNNENKRRARRTTTTKRRRKAEIINRDKQEIEENQVKIGTFPASITSVARMIPSGRE
jgi:hypothetical protein